MAGSTSHRSTVSSQACTSVLLLHPRSKARCTPIRTTIRPPAPSRRRLPSTSTWTCSARLQCLNSRVERGRNAQTPLDQLLPLPALANLQWRDQCRLVAKGTSHLWCRPSRCSNLSARHRNRTYHPHLPRYHNLYTVRRAQGPVLSHQNLCPKPSWGRPQNQPQLSNPPQSTLRVARTQALV